MIHTLKACMRASVNTRTRARAHTHTHGAKVALAQLVGYASDLRSVTGGAASFHMSFSHFDAQ